MFFWMVFARTLNLLRVVLIQHLCGGGGAVEKLVILVVKIVHG